ncbi:hypothetical protein [Shinella sp.]|uniref:hypothetical protein n=1 Tax=Shinella sp. TaxID=1870904 RepID=UPI003F722EAB
MEDAVKTVLGLYPATRAEIKAGSNWRAYRGLVTLKCLQPAYASPRRPIGSGEDEEPVVMVAACRPSGQPLS